MTEHVQILLNEIHRLAAMPDDFTCTVCHRVKTITNSTRKNLKNITCDACLPPTHMACPVCQVETPLEDVNPYKGCITCIRRNSND